MLYDWSDLYISKVSIALLQNTISVILKSKLGHNGLQVVQIIKYKKYCLTILWQRFIDTFSRLLEPWLVRPLYLKNVSKYVPHHRERSRINIIYWDPKKIASG